MELAEEGDPVPVIQPAVEAQDSVARAVIERRVLEQALTSYLDELHVHLNAVAGPVPLEQLELPWPALADGLHPREPELADDALDRPSRDPEPMHPPEPELGPCGPVAEVDARMPNEIDQRVRDPPRSSRGVPGDEAANPIRPPARAPTPDCPRRASEAPTRRSYPVRCRILEHQQPLLHPRYRLGTAASRITASHSLLMHSPFPCLHYQRLLRKSLLNRLLHNLRHVGGIVRAEQLVPEQWKLLADFPGPAPWRPEPVRLWEAIESAQQP
jgi:hypothetical protein